MRPIPIKYLVVLLLLLCKLAPLWAQQNRNEQQDERQKVEHADPVFEDLTTDLGARKGENELNINFGYQGLKGEHRVLFTQLEYEFAPMDNLGFEVILPYTAYFTNPITQQARPANRVEFLQWAMQYTFFSSHERGISLALSFRNTFGQEDEFEPRNQFTIDQIQYFPFLVGAKNWQDRFFLLFSGGSALNQDLVESEYSFEHQINTAFHYGLGEDDHYLGVELNKSLKEREFEMTIRPQIILELADDIILGAAIGLPVVSSEGKGLSGFLRLAYEFQ